MSFSPLDLNLELSLEQEFQLKVMQESAKEISHDRAVSLLMDATRLLMVKDNAIRSLMRQNLSA